MYAIPCVVGPSGDSGPNKAGAEAGNAQLSIPRDLVSRQPHVPRIPVTTQREAGDLSLRPTGIRCYPSRFTVHLITWSAGALRLHKAMPRRLSLFPLLAVLPPFSSPNIPIHSLVQVILRGD